MADGGRSSNAERALRVILRVIGFNSMFALIFVAAPFSWMDAIHARLGMGTLSDQPVVGYLARSTSFFYVLLGGLFWVVSFDLARYRPLLVYLGFAVTSFGGVLLAVDWSAGLPRLWALWEGPFVVAFGVTLLLCSLRLRGWTAEQRP